MNAPLNHMPVTDAPTQERIPKMRLYDAIPSLWCPLLLSRGSCSQGQTGNEGMIVAVMSGELIASTSNNTVTVKGGRMILIPPGMDYRLESYSLARAMICTFTDDTLFGWFPQSDQLIATIPQNPSHPFRMLPFGGQVGSMFAQTENYINRGIATQTLLEIKQQEFFCLLIAIYTPKELAAFLAPMLSGEIEFRNLVSEYWLEAGNVMRLAQLSGYSLSGFIKKFQRVYGQPPYQWMQQRRAELVLSEVTMGSDPLKKIAHRYHFRSYQHFSTFCVRYFGARPTDLRGNQAGKPVVRSKIHRHNPIQSKLHNSA